MACATSSQNLFDHAKEKNCEAWPKRRNIMDLCLTFLGPCHFWGENKSRTSRLCNFIMEVFDAAQVGNVFFCCLALIHYIKASRRLRRGFAELRGENAFKNNAAQVAVLLHWKFCQLLANIWENHKPLMTDLCKGVSRAVTSSTGRVAGSYKKPPFRMTIISRFSTIDLAAPFRMQVASSCFLWE